MTTHTKNRKPAPQRTTTSLLDIVGLLAMLAACGDTSASFNQDPPAPGDPARGAAAQVLIHNLDLQIWVGVDDPAVADQLRANRTSGAQEWLIGEVVPSKSHHLGFYFEPSTITSFEITAEGIQTTLDQIQSNPAFYEKGGTGGFPQWAVMADDILDVR